MDHDTTTENLFDKYITEHKIRPLRDERSPGLLYMSPDHNTRTAQEIMDSAGFRDFVVTSQAYQFD